MHPDDNWDTKSWDLASTDDIPSPANTPTNEDVDFRIPNTPMELTRGMRMGTIWHLTESPGIDLLTAGPSLYAAIPQVRASSVLNVKGQAVAHSQHAELERLCTCSHKFAARQAASMCLHGSSWRHVGCHGYSGSLPPACMHRLPRACMPTASCFIL